MLNSLTQGTLHLGIGRGTAKMEYDAYNIDMNEGRARFSEVFKIVEQGLAGKPFSHRGQFWNIERPIRISSRSRQQARALLRRDRQPGERRGDGRSRHSPDLPVDFSGRPAGKDPRALAGRAGAKANGAILPISVKMFIADTDEEARELGRRYYPPYFALQADHYEADANPWVDIPEYADFSRMFANLRKMTDPAELGPVPRFQSGRQRRDHLQAHRRAGVARLQLFHGVLRDAGHAARDQAADDDTLRGRDLPALFQRDAQGQGGMNAASTRKKPSLSVVGQPGTFNAIQKVCAIMRVLAQNSPLRLTEIAEATSLNKATTLRILVSLIEEGFVSRVAGAKTYELGQEARVMAISARRTVDIAELAQPSLLRLSERSADTALLSVRSGVEALYLARSVGSHPLQPNYLQIGSRRPLGVGAGSLALMVWLPDAEIDAIIDVILPLLAKSPRITPKYLRERINSRPQARSYRAARRRLSRHGRGRRSRPRRCRPGDCGAQRRRVQRPDPAREAELAEMLKKEALILARAMAQPVKPGR